MLDSCSDFAYNQLGAKSLRMTEQQMLDHGRGRITALDKASYAFDRLYESPLKFQRNGKSEKTNYVEIHRSCRQLELDFDDDSKWVR